MRENARFLALTALGVLPWLLLVWAIVAVVTAGLTGDPVGD